MQAPEKRTRRVSPLSTQVVVSTHRTTNHACYRSVKAVNAFFVWMYDMYFKDEHPGLPCAFYEPTDEDKERLLERTGVDEMDNNFIELVREGRELFFDPKFDLNKLRPLIEDIKKSQTYKSRPDY